ncbi:MAG TPA: fructose-1,6-bisphosphatase, partial [Rhizobiales bacterium]|nr:fructose-1,6-bisphosphatase [Hyphomicrobiales bacterium]
MSTRHQTLSDFLGQWAGTDAMRGKVRDTILALADATASISAFVASASLNGAAPEPAGMRPWLITSARNIVTKALKGAPVAAISCEKSNGPHPVNPGAELVVALDSMDGSSNIETNASVGGIFSIMTNSNGKGDAASFLQKGRDQLAAGFMMYGPQTLMVFTTGNGTHVATLDRESREFIITATDLHVEQTVREYAVNASNYRHWDDGTRAYIDDCLAGSEGPREENYTMRWVAALVA